MNRPANRYCVITPYYREDRAMLTRCMNSVRRQSKSVDHILVADGFPQDWIGDQPVRHIILNRPHADYGNFARGVGAMEAVNSGYDGVMFLDADNWYDDDHVEKCLAVVADNPTTAFIAARRRFVRADQTVMASVTPSELPFEEHVDTNCMFLRWPIFPFLHHWCTMPQELAGSGDHLFYLLMMVNGLKPVCVPTPTVNYLCLFDTVYRELGEEPPAEAKPIISWEDNQAWIDSLSPIDLARVCNLVGMRLFQKHEQPGAVS